jgi:hypothetical protein
VKRARHLALMPYVADLLKILKSVVGFLKHETLKKFVENKQNLK